MSRILYLTVCIVAASIVGFLAGVRLTSKHKDQSWDRVSKFSLSAEVSTQLDLHTLLGESLLKDDSASQEIAAKMLAAAIELGTQRILEDREGVGQLTNQEKIDRATRTKESLLARASFLKKDNPDAEQGVHGNTH
jgi:hypothetical protein